jgi:hypothetical protein
VNKEKEDETGREHQMVDKKLFAIFFAGNGGRQTGRS